MSAEYFIDVEPERDLVRIRMAGFFTEADIAGFLETRRVAHARLTCGAGAHLTLSDLRGMKIQAQETVDAFRRVLSMPGYRSKRLAFVVGTTLARSQLLRALETRDARFFDEIKQAEAWLLATPDSRAA